MAILLGIGSFYISKPEVAPKEIVTVKNSENNFAKVETKIKLERSPSSLPTVTIASKDFELFLDKNNPHHILLSHKILRRIPTTPDAELYSVEEKKLRDYERSNQLTYADELEKILRAGKFYQNTSEEYFLLDEFSRLKPELSLYLLEEKLNLSITKLNEQKNPTEEQYFKFLLSIYLKQMETSSFNMQERRKLLNEQITSPALKKIFNDNWVSNDLDQQP